MVLRPLFLSHPARPLIESPESSIIVSSTPDYMLRYTFDENGDVCGYAYKGTNSTGWIWYRFVKNLQGDVIQVYRNYDGALTAEYEYDSWGNVIASSGTGRNINPFRYRGYYYDRETGLYYLQSRYYDPAIGRFINADAFAATGQSFLGCNMFAYCLNSPIGLVDYSGMKPADAAMSAGRTMGVLLASLLEAYVEIAIETVTDAVSYAVEYVTNDDEQKVLDAEHFAFYKGVPVAKIPFMGNNMASFGVILMGPDAKWRTNAIEDTKHEYGHSVHLSQIGFMAYVSTVAIPSLIGYFSVSNEEYYSQPWEYIAEILGGVTNRTYQGQAYTYSSSAPKEAGVYWIYTVFLP